MVSLIDCPSCHATISDDRENCPNCNAPVNATKESFESLAARIGVLNFRLAVKHGAQTTEQKDAQEMRDEIARLEKELSS